MSPRGVAQLARFCAVGATNTLLTLGVFLGLTDAGVPTLAASALAFAVGAANGYLLNRAWTFRADGAVGRYVAVQALGAGASALGVAIAVRTAALPRLADEAVVLPPVTLLTYTLSRRLVFVGARRA